MVKNLEKTAQEILGIAGININGNNTWDMQVHDPRCYERVLTNGSLGLGESYIDGDWDCRRIDELFEKIINTKVEQKAKKHLNFLTKIKLLSVKTESFFGNRQSVSKSRKVGEQHYDIGNELYELMLDPGMQYSCGYWKNSKNLEEAQLDKLDLICRKLELRPHMTIFDIGCGWGGFLKFAAEKYRVGGLGVSISKEQVRFGQESCEGLPVEIRDQDYRSVKEKFNRIVSVGMFEHVGRKNYKEYFQKAAKSLDDNGLFLLQTIGKNNSKFSADPFINKYIFPGGELPSLAMITKAVEGLFVVRDVHNFGGDYDRTLMAWNKNFQDKWSQIKEQGNGRYDERFKRMWEYYLQSCAGAFRAGNIQLWQIVLSKPGFNGNYKSVR